jgi:hypothetical protein
MKQLLSVCLIVAFSLFTKVNAQFTENFSSSNLGSVPSGWTVSSNTDINSYSNKIDGCTVANKGLQTPGVGKNAPVRLLLPAQTFDVTKPNVVVNFKVYVFDANLNCVSMKDLPCATFIKAYVVKSTFSSTNSSPVAADIYSEQPAYEISNENGINVIAFNNLSIPTGTNYRVLLDFKSGDNANCSSSGTKFVFDDFSITSSASCEQNSCVPVAKDDYFDAELQGFGATVNGKVFGGNVQWNSQAPAAYSLSSLHISPAVDGGTDLDINNPDLSAMTFTLVSGPVVLSSSNCNGPAPVGTLEFHSNGTFTYTRGSACVSKISFTYKVADAEGNESGTATVTIKLPVSQGSTLPVTFKSFTATRVKNSVNLKWETSSEENNKGFEVERKTTGGWIKVAYAASKAQNGNSGSVLTYTVSDLNTESGISQYRIRQVDLDGASKFSEVRTVRGEQQAAKVLVYPNPSSESKVNVLFDAPGTLYNVELIDINGRIVKQWASVANNLTITDLTPGQYMLRAQNKSTLQITSEKIVIRK